MQQYRLWEGQLEVWPTEKDLGMLVNSQLNMSHQCAQVAEQANSILAYVKNSVASRTSKVTVSLYIVLLRLHLKYCILFGAPSTRRILSLSEKSNEAGGGTRKQDYEN